MSRTSKYYNRENSFGSDSDDSVDVVVKRPHEKRRSERYYDDNNAPSHSSSTTSTNSRRTSPSTREWESRNSKAQWNRKDSNDEPIMNTRFVPKSVVSSEALNAGRPVAINQATDSWASAPYRANHPRSRLDESDLMPSSNNTNKENIDSRRRSDWSQARPKQPEVSRSWDMERNERESSFHSQDNFRPKTSSDNNTRSQRPSQRYEDYHDYERESNQNQNQSQPSRQSSQRSYTTIVSKPAAADYDVEVDDLYSTYPQTSSMQPSRRPSANNNDYEEAPIYFNKNVNPPISSASFSNINDDNAFYEKSSGQYVISSPQEDSVRNSYAIPRSVTGSGIPRIFNGKHSFVQIAHDMDTNTEHLQCVIVRSRSMASALNPLSSVCYELILQETKKSLIMAQKKTLNRTSNYHLFDLTRGHVGGKFSKKSGNFIGKLRAKSMSRIEYVVVNHNINEREELASVAYDRSSILEQITEGSQPREMQVIVPPVDADEHVPVPFRAKDASPSAGEGMTSLVDCLGEEATIPAGYHLLKSKQPVFENGNYRLNFNGRVSMASVKNFQLVVPGDEDNIICQFGKVGEDCFHLDFKAPLNAVQAFALALTQFNL